MKLSPEAVAQERVRVAGDAGDEPLGFSVVLAVSDGVGELDGLFVAPEHMRAGIGRALLADAQRRTRQAGARELLVTSGPGSVLFYEQAGFELGEPVQTRFGHARRMRRNLRSGGGPVAKRGATA